MAAELGAGGSARGKHHLQDLACMCTHFNYRYSQTQVYHLSFLSFAALSLCIMSIIFVFQSVRFFLPELASEFDIFLIISRLCYNRSTQEGCITFSGNLF